jgi:hypothetical protein
LMVTFMGEVQSFEQLLTPPFETPVTLPDITVAVPLLVHAFNPPLMVSLSGSDPHGGLGRLVLDGRRDRTLNGPAGVDAPA